MRGGGAHIGLRPDRAGRLEHAARVHRRNQAVGHQRRRLRIREVRVAGPVGQHHRAAEQHPLRRDQAEPLAPVQRKHDVRTGGQRMVVGQRQGARLEPDVAHPVRRLPQPLQIGPEMPGMPHLHHQHPVRPAAERLPVRGDRGQRVLARERGGQAERAQRHHRLRRQPERLPVQRGGRRRSGRHAIRHHPHPPWQQRLDRGGGEARRRPHLVHEAHPGRPIRRRHRQLPRPAPDDPAAPQEPPRQPQQRGGHMRRVHVQHQRCPRRGRTRRRRRATRDRHILPLARQPQPGAQRPAGDAKLGQPRQHQPRPLAQPGRAAKLPGHHHPVLPRRRHPVRTRRHQGGAARQPTAPLPRRQGAP